MKKAWVLHHANCNDGFCAAWLFHRYMAQEFYHGCEVRYQPINYGEEAPDVTGWDVYILDFSFPRVELEEMYSKANFLIVLDHHESAENDLEGLDYCRFAQGISSAHLAWQYFDERLAEVESPDMWRPKPWLVDYTEDRDLWKWELPSSREVNEALRFFKRSFEVWDHLAENRWESYADMGKHFLEKKEAEVEAATQDNRIGWSKIGGHVVPCVNTTIHVSEIVGTLAKGYPFAAGFFILPTGEVVYSLRSTKGGGLDVSKIAEGYGGGGHRNAAGFRLDAHLPIIAEYPHDEG